STNASCRSDGSALKSQRTRNPVQGNMRASAFDHSTAAIPSGLLLVVSLILSSGSDEEGPHIGVIMRNSLPPFFGGSTTRSRRCPRSRLGFSLPPLPLTTASQSLLTLMTRLSFSRNSMPLNKRRQTARKSTSRPGQQLATEVIGRELIGLPLAS